MLNEKLKYYRKMRNLTQEEVAIKINITKSCYSNYEQGTREPSIDILKKLCIVFEITADELLEIETEEQKSRVLKLDLT